MNDCGRAGIAINRTGRHEAMHHSDDNEPKSNGNSQGSSKDDHVVLPVEAQGRIGQHLRRVYGEILAEPLPDKFSKLLSELAKAERKE
jgi:hypothetical protein